MSRKNPKRRLIERIKSWDKQAHDLTVNANANKATDSVAMTTATRSGNIVKAHSSLTKFANKSGSLRPPKESLDGQGKRGKIVNGKFKPVKPGQKKVFSQAAKGDVPHPQDIKPVIGESEIK